jgi:hypothetical protein
MEIEVRGEAMSVTTPVSKIKQPGKYHVVKEDKTVVILYTDADGQTDPQTFTFVDNKTMKWSVVDGRPIAITFKRIP